MAEPVECVTATAEVNRLFEALSIAGSVEDADEQESRLYQSGARPCDALRDGGGGAMPTVPGGAAPGRGKTPAQRHVDDEAAPNPLAELMSRPAKNSQEITGVVPDITQRSSVPEIPAAPVVDVRDLVDRRLSRLADAGEGIEP